MTPASQKLLSDVRWSAVNFLVKANENEQFYLWKQYAKQADDKNEIDWSSFGDSKAIIIDYINEKPITLCLTFVKMNDCLVCFYDAISRLVDWDIVIDVLKNHYTAKWMGNKAAVCGVVNFKDCIKYVTNEKTREVKKDKAEKVGQ